MSEAVTPWRHARTPLVVAAARLKGHPGRSLLVAAGIAASIATLVVVDGGSVVARDRAVQEAVAALPASQRSFRVDVFNLVSGQTYEDANRTVRRGLATLTPQVPLRTTSFRVLRIGGGLVQLFSLDALDRYVRLRSGRLPRACTPARCEVIELARDGRSRWSQEGLNLVRVGSGDVADRALFGDSLQPVREPGGERATLLIASGAAAFDRLPALAGTYRYYSWIAPLEPRSLHAWEIPAVLARESRAQGLLNPLAYFALSGPDRALMDARSKGRIAAQRMVLLGGGASTLLIGFALVAAIGLRRSLAAERRRLLQHGARRAQLWLAHAAEVSAPTVAGAAVGVALGAAAVELVAARAGLPGGAVLAHSLASALGAGLVGAAWLAGTAAVLLVARAREAPRGRRGVRLLDVAALGAAGAVGIGLSRGGLNADTIASHGSSTLLLALPGLVCFVAAVVAGRLLGPLMRLTERAARRGPIALRLAVLALARAPARTIATTAFLLVALGLALFAACYRATLQRGARDEAAFAVPLDYTLTEGTQLVAPLDAAPLHAYERLAPGTRAYPALRATASVAGPGTTALGPTVLGLPAAAVARVRWRSDYSNLSQAELAQRLGADGPAALRGVPAAPGIVSLQTRIRGAAVQLDLAVQDGAGRTTLVTLTARGAGRRTLRARLPSGTRRLVGLELSLAGSAQYAFLHHQAEGHPSAAPGGGLKLGPLREGGRVLTAWRGWVARGDARLAGDRVSYTFTEGEASLLRRPQPTDGRPLRVVVSPEIARSAGPGGAITLDFPSEQVPALIVGVARRFPGAEQQDEGFVVADESRLATVLDARLPGTGAADELWLSGPPQLGRALAASPLQLASRRDLQRSLASDPLARGLILTLAASTLAALVLAVVGLWLALVSDLRDERGELFDLEAQGVSPTTLRRQFRLRAAVLVALGTIGGALLGLFLSRLVVALVRVSAATEPPRPPLHLELPWLASAAGLAALLAAAAIVLELTTRHAFRSESPVRRSWSLE